MRGCLLAVLVAILCLSACTGRQNVCPDGTLAGEDGLCRQPDSQMTTVLDKKPTTSEKPTTTLSEGGGLTQNEQERIVRFEKKREADRLREKAVAAYIGGDVGSAKSLIASASLIYEDIDDEDEIVESKQIIDYIEGRPSAFSDKAVLIREGEGLYNDGLNSLYVRDYQRAYELARQSKDKYMAAEYVLGMEKAQLLIDQVGGLIGGRQTTSSLPTTSAQASTATYSIRSVTTSSIKPYQFYTVCSNQRCVKVAGIGKSNCTMDAQCEIRFIYCNDSEQWGIDNWQKGEVIMEDVEGRVYQYVDHCISETVLTEYWCARGKLMAENVTCPDICDDGKCAVDY